MFNKSHTPTDLSIAFGVDVPTVELQRLDELSTAVSIPAGTILMREGNFGREVLLVVRGQMLVERGGEPVAVVEAGSVVGEQAVLLNARRNATVSAATDAEVLAMSPCEFDSVLEDCPTIARYILKTAVAHASRAAA